MGLLHNASTARTDDDGRNVPILLAIGNRLARAFATATLCLLGMAGCGLEATPSPTMPGPSPTPTGEAPTPEVVTLLLEVEPPGGGTITSDGVPLTPGAIELRRGQQLPIEAVPAEGSAFEGWSGDVIGGRASRTLQISRPMRVVAHFRNAGPEPTATPEPMRTPVPVPAPIPTPTPTPTLPVTIMLHAVENSVQPGGEFGLEVWVDPHGEAFDRGEITVEYPADVALERSSLFPEIAEEYRLVPFAGVPGKQRYLIARRQGGVGVTAEAPVLVLSFRAHGRQSFEGRAFPIDAAFRAEAKLAHAGSGGALPTVATPATITIVEPGPAPLTIAGQPVSAGGVALPYGDVVLDPRPSPDGMYPFRSTVKIEAVPLNGFRLAGWTGACEGTIGSICIVTVDGATDAAPVFTSETGLGITLFLNGEPVINEVEELLGGSVRFSPDPTYTWGTRVTLVAEPWPTMDFARWGGACAAFGEAPVCTITVDAERYVEAFFEGNDFSPASISSVATTSDTATVHFSRSGVNAASFTIERRPFGSQTWEVVGTAPGDVRALTDTGLSPSTTYCYRVSVVLIQGVTVLPVNERCATTKAEP